MRNLALIRQIDHIIAVIENLSSQVESLSQEVHSHEMDIHNLYRRAEGWPVENWDDDYAEDRSKP
ncbi:MAG: hypothetical protein K8I82_01695 [Anaerolineae bacterium]|nr:hypothetical protein [Anaerolineae bacterium]